MIDDKTVVCRLMAWCTLVIVCAYLLLWEGIDKVWKSLDKLHLTLYREPFIETTL